MSTQYSLKTVDYESPLVYAIDSLTGKIVNIGNVENGAGCHCICPSCKGALIAKNNCKVRIHHFAHQSGVECPDAYESMLHLLAKERIRDVFLSSDVFYIEYDSWNFCPKDECVYNEGISCSVSERRRFNLKDYYDSCEQEKPYDNILRRSDLKFFSLSNRDRPPLYIEFCVSHPSDEHKLHSGNRIIEVVLQNEHNIDCLVRSGFIENHINIDKMRGESLLPETHFYGFKKEFKTASIVLPLLVKYYALYRSGKYMLKTHIGKCNSEKKYERNTLYEMHFYNTELYDYEYAMYRGYEKFPIPNCSFCKHYVIRKTKGLEYGSCRCCSNIPKDMNLDKETAKQCHYYDFNKEKMDRVLKEVEDLYFEEFY